MIQFDWSKLTTIDSNPVTPDTNGYNLETGGFICNQTNQKNGYKRLRIDGTVTTFKKPVTKLVTDCLLYTSPSPRDREKSRMPSSA